MHWEQEGLQRILKCKGYKDLKQTPHAISCLMDEETEAKGASTSLQAVCSTFTRVSVECSDLGFTGEESELQKMMYLAQDGNS